MGTHWPLNIMRDLKRILDFTSPELRVLREWARLAHILVRFIALTL